MSLRQTQKYHHPRGSERLVSAVTFCVSLAELRTHLRIPSGETEENDYLDDLIEQATFYIEDWSGISLINQTFTLTMDNWPGYHEPWWDGVREGTLDSMRENARAADLTIPRWPLVSVEDVKVYNESSTETAVTIASVFDIDLTSRPGRMTLQRGATWPTATRANRAIVINYTAGYGATAADVPPTLRRAVLEMAAYMWTHRGECVPETAFNRSGAERLMRMYRVRGV